MQRMKLNIDGLSSYNISVLSKYLSHYKIEHSTWEVPLTKRTVKMLIVLSSSNNNARKLIDNNHELISTVLSNVELTQNDINYLKKSNNPFINSLLTLIT